MQVRVGWIQGGVVAQSHPSDSSSTSAVCKSQRPNPTGLGRLAHLPELDRQPAAALDAKVLILTTLLFSKS